MTSKTLIHTVDRQLSRLVAPLARAVASYNRFLRQYPWLRSSLYFGLIFALFWFVCFQRLDPDFGWHLRTGQAILDHHSVPHQDTYSFTAHGFRWVEFEWGHDVVVAWLYNLGGFAAVATGFAGLWTASLFVAARRARFHVLLLAALAIMPYTGIRPLVWTTLFFAVLLTVLRSKRTKLRRWLPLLFFVWANIHAGFIAGLFVMGYVAYHKRSWRLSYLLLICVMVTLLNPYGWLVYGEIWRTVMDRSLHYEITEWFPFALRGISWPFIVLWGAGSLAYNKRRQIVTLSRLLLLSALSASRNLPLFAVSAVQELDDSLSKVKAALPQQLDLPRRLLIRTFLTLILLTTYGLVAVQISLLNNPREANYPVAAVAYLQQHRCPGNLFNAYNAGGYLIWKLPQQPVYIDGRMPTWHPYMEQYMQVIQHPKQYYRVTFQRYNIHCALLNTGPNRSVVKVLEQAHWKPKVQANGWILLENR